MKKTFTLPERRRLLKKIVDKKWTVAEAARRSGMSRALLHRWLTRYTDGTQFGRLDKKTSKAKILEASVSPRKGVISKRPLYLVATRIKAIEEFKRKEKSVADICREFNLSETIFYRWLKRYQKAGSVAVESASSSKSVTLANEVHPESATAMDVGQVSMTKQVISDQFNEHQALLALENKIPRPFVHPRQTPEKYEELILDAVSHYPELSAHRLSTVLPTIGTQPVVGPHGVQNVLRRHDLNTYEKRVAFAHTYQKTPYVSSTIVKTLLSGIYSLFGLPLKAQNSLLSGLISFVIPVSLSVIVLGFWNYLKIYTQAPSIGVGIGYIFASLALMFGMFFFFYSAKYYMSVILVLIFSRQILPEKNKSDSWNSDMLKSAKPSGLLPDVSHIELDRQPFVSIQLPLYNEKRVVNRLLEAVTSIDYEHFEVIVCDDSTDETKEIVEEWRYHPKIKISHRDTRKGFKGAALAQALKIMDKRAEFVIIFDADFLPYPDSITQFLRYFKLLTGSLEQKVYSRSKIAALQGYQWHVLNKSENWITRGVRSEYAGSYVIERSSAEIYGGLKQIAGSVYMIRTDAMKAIGWGDSITEDFEMTLRLYAKGYRVAYTPYIQTPSECVSTLKRLVRQRMRWAEGHSFNIKKVFWEIILSKNTTVAEKLEFFYLTPYYLQSFFFLLGTLSWFIAETVFQVRLPFWTAVWGWSLVLTNMLSLPLMNLVGMFLEEAEEKDFLGLFSFVLLTYVVAPFQAYAAVKGFLEKEEGPWFRTPKTGRITDVFRRGRFYRWLSAVFPTGQPAQATTVSTGNVAGSLMGNAKGLFQIKKARNKRIANVAFAFSMSFILLLTGLSPYITDIGRSYASTNEFRSVPYDAAQSEIDQVTQDKSGITVANKNEIIKNVLKEDIVSPRNVIKRTQEGDQIEFIFHQEPRVRIKMGDSEIEYQTLSIGGNPVKAQKSVIYADKEVLYVDALPGIDIKYTLNGKLITEEFILKNRESINLIGDIQQDLKVNGLKVVSADPGTFGFYFSDGKEALRFSDPFARDAAGEMTLDVRMSLEKTAFGHSLTKSLGESTMNWLNDEGRAFPIAIDPTIVVSGGIDETETQFGSLQRKLAYVSSNWYAFYNTDGKIYYKKSSDGVSWNGPVDVDSSDNDNYNPSISVSSTAIYAFWIDNGADRAEGRRIDTSSSDALGTLCQTSVEAGTIDDSFMVTVAGLSTSTSVIAYTDTDADTEVNAFSLSALDGSCTGNTTSIITGNVTFGSGITSLDRPVLVPIDSNTVDVIFQDGNLSYSRYLVLANEWVDNNITVASVTHNIYSVVSDGTTVWILAADTTQNDEALLYSCCSDDISNTQIDADAGGNGQDISSDIDIFCVSDTDCKLVYTDNIDSTGSQDLVFVDCDDATCSTSQSYTIDADLDADADGTSTVGNPAVFCTSTDDCKIVYQDNYDDAAPDAVFYDCDDADGAGDNIPCDDGFTATITDTDIGGTLTVSHFDIYCVSSTECAYVFFEDNNNDVMFVDCENDECAVASDTVTSIVDIGTGTTGPFVSVYCTSVTTCKVVTHDVDAGALVFVNCVDGTSAANDESCIGITPDTLDASVGTSVETVAVAVHCMSSETDCKVLYSDSSDIDVIVKFLDCNDSDCDTPASTTIDSNVLSFNKTTIGIVCPAADNCKLIIKAFSSTSNNYVYFIDCANATCSSGSATPLEYPNSDTMPRGRYSISCPASDNCKMVAYKGQNTKQPTVNFYDCDSESCLPTSADLADPWTGETNLTSVSLTYDSTNSDLIASALMDSSEQAYFRTYDLGTSGWDTESSYGFTPGNLGHISAPYTVAGLTQMGVVVRQGTNFEFSTLPENLWVMLLTVPVLSRFFNMKKGEKRRKFAQTK